MRSGAWRWDSCGRPPEAGGTTRPTPRLGPLRVRLGGVYVSRRKRARSISRPSTSAFSQRAGKHQPRAEERHIQLRVCDAAVLIASQGKTLKEARRAGAEAQRCDHFLQRLHEFDQHALAADRERVVASAWMKQMS